MMKSRKNAFTLIELLVVCTIIAIIAAITTVSITTYKARTRDSRRISDLASLKRAILLYHTNTPYNYPGTPLANSDYCFFPGLVARGTAPQAKYSGCLTAELVTAYFPSLPQNPRIVDNDFPDYMYFIYSDENVAPTAWANGPVLATKLEMYNGSGMQGTFRKASNPVDPSICTTSDNHWYCLNFN